jgi:4-amino-4-deoxy-L-arabinose transferase-like glycosyltransferase
MMSSSDSRPWWREPEMLGLVLLVIVAYFLRAGELPIRGEEPTRGLTAFEMVQSGDWLVPHCHGAIFGIRPPLQPWLIAATCRAFGNWDPWYVRLHSLVATLLATLLVYGYCRSFLGRLGSLAAAVAFATLADMFQMGRQAETEAIFILLVSASLLVWHWGLMRRWSETATWSLGYGIAALAMLTKGLQAPAYFVGATFVYLTLSGQFRRLFTRAHAVGMLVGASVLAAWIVPYARQVGIAGALDPWFGDQAMQLEHFHPTILQYLRHAVELAAEIAAGTMPWSLLLLLFLRRDFRQSLGVLGSYVLFLTIASTLALISIYVHPGGQPRYVAPIFPCLAALIGIVVERCTQVGAREAWRTAWNRYLGLIVGVMLSAGTIVFGMSAAGVLGAPHWLRTEWIETPAIAVAYLAICLGLAGLLWRARQRPGAGPARAAVIAIAAFLVITFIGIVHNIRVRLSEHPADDVASIRAKLPPDQQIVRLGTRMDCMFPYYWKLPQLTTQAWPSTAEDVSEGTCFCFMCGGDNRPSLPFPWEEIGIVSIDRNHHPIPQAVVVVGRRVADLPRESIPVWNTSNEK